MSPGAPASRWQCWLDTSRDAGGGPAQLSSGLVRNGVISWTSVQDGGPGNLKAERTVLPYLSGALPCSASAGCPVGRLTGRGSVDSRLPEGQDGRGVLMGGTGRGEQGTSVCCPVGGHGPPDGPLTHRRQTSDHLDPPGATARCKALRSTQPKGLVSVGSSPAALGTTRRTSEKSEENKSGGERGNTTHEQGAPSRSQPSPGSLHSSWVILMC